MPSEVQIKLNINDAQAVAALLRTQQGFHGISKAFAGATRVTDKTQTSMQKMWTTAGQGAISVVGAITGVTGALGAALTVANLFHQRLADIQQRNAMLARASIGPGQAFEEAADALGAGRSFSDGSKFGPQELEAIVKRVAAKGIKSSAVSMAAKDIFSSAGFRLGTESGTIAMEDVEPMLEAVFALNSQAKVDKEEAQKRAFGITQLMATGKMTPMGSAALLEKVFTASAGRDTSAVAERILPLVNQLHQAAGGDSMHEMDFDFIADVVSFGAAISQGSADPRLRKTQTGIINASTGRLQAALEKGGVKVQPGMDIFDMRDLLDENPEIKATFLGATAAPYFRAEGQERLAQMAAGAGAGEAGDLIAWEAEELARVAAAAGTGSGGGEAQTKPAFTSFFMGGDIRRLHDATRAAIGDSESTLVKEALKNEAEKKGTKIMQGFLMDVEREAQAEYAGLTDEAIGQKFVADAGTKLKESGEVGLNRIFMDAGEYIESGRAFRDRPDVAQQIDASINRLEVRRMNLLRGTGFNQAFNERSATLGRPLSDREESILANHYKNELENEDTRKHVEDISRMIQTGDRLKGMLGDGDAVKVEVVGEATTVAAPDAQGFNN